MKKLIVWAVMAPFLFGTVPAFAVSDAKKADLTPPTCGKTVTECQNAWDMDEQKLRELSIAIQGMRQQRDTAQSALGDRQIQDFVTQQTTKK